MCSPFPLFSPLAGPVVSVSPQNLTVIQPQPASFYCNASGFPAPSLQWYKEDGTNLTLLVNSTKYLISNSTGEESSQGSLTITESNPFDTATYICVASSVVGNDSQSSSLRVYGKTESLLPIWPQGKVPWALHTGQTSADGPMQCHIVPYGSSGCYNAFLF